MTESEIAHRALRSSHRAIAVLLAMAGFACTPIPWWAYLAETRVSVASDSGAFSEQEIERAQALTARVARVVGMAMAIHEPLDLEIEEYSSKRKSPPRRFLDVYKGRLDFGRPLALRVELSDDGRTLYFSLLDPNQGSPSPTVERIYKVLNEKVAAEFPTAVVVHDPRALGPFFELEG